MGAKIKIESMPSWNITKKRFADIPAQIKKNANVALTKAAFIIEGESKKYTPVDTGRLRASIYTKVGSKDAVVQPYTNYAVYVHRRIPYMTTGLEMSRTKIEKLFKQSIDTSFKRFISNS